MGFKDKHECWCGSGEPYETCHKNFDKKLNEFKKKKCILPPKKLIKNKNLN